jgi:spermidine/putrescine transport system permease protein
VKAVARQRAGEGSVETAAPVRRSRRPWTARVLPVYATAVFAYLLIPIATMFVYSFNNSRSRLPTVTFNWQGFTTRWYGLWDQIPGLTPAFFLSLRLALLSSSVSAILGTLLALTLARYRFRGKGAVEQVLLLPIAVPEIVLGASLLGFFITLNLPKGFLTLFIAHVTFSISFVAITVRARISGFDLSVEEAARDLYATPWATFRKVTLPLIYPGILAGALLAFGLSVDDFVTSNFVAGTTSTFPLWVWGAVKIGIPPQVFVLGTMIFTSGAVVAAVSVLLQERRRWSERRDARSYGVSASA